MTIINSYPISTPKTHDSIVGTSMTLADTVADQITKYFPVSSIVALVSANPRVYVAELSDFGDGELAYTSFDRVLKEYTKRSDTFNRIHPTQKPVALYKWLLKNYAKEGDRILDTHLGSGSSRIAAHDMGFDFVGYEIDKDYFDAQELRFANHIKQQSLFKPNEMY